jgi:hypothetical protein
MSNRMDVKSWRKSRNGKAYAVRIGSTWTNDKGVTYIEFDALPLPDDQGRVSCFLEQPRERPETAPERQEVGTQGFARQLAPSAPGPKPIPLGGDEIPF